MLTFVALKDAKELEKPLEEPLRAAEERHDLAAREPVTETAYGPSTSGRAGRRRRRVARAAGTSSQVEQMQIVEVRAAALAAEEQDLFAVSAERGSLGVVASVGHREFWRVKSGVGGDGLGRFGNRGPIWAVGGERRWILTPMAVQRCNFAANFPYSRARVGREWARSAHVRGEVVVGDLGASGRTPS